MSIFSKMVNNRNKEKVHEINHAEKSLEEYRMRIEEECRQLNQDLIKTIAVKNMLEQQHGLLCCITEEWIEHAKTSVINDELESAKAALRKVEEYKCKRAVCMAELEKWQIEENTQKSFRLSLKQKLEDAKARSDLLNTKNHCVEAPTQIHSEGLNTPAAEVFFDCFEAYTDQIEATIQTIDIKSIMSTERSLKEQALRLSEQVIEDALNQIKSSNRLTSTYK